MSASGGDSARLGCVGEPVFFDDRLATVLRQRITGEAGLRTQFRQLLDLLGRYRTHRGQQPDQSLIAAAWLRMDALAEAIPADERARMIREPGWRFESAELAAHLADHEPEVASAALNRADLASQDWIALIPRLPLRARGFLRLRRDLPVDVEAVLAQLGVQDRGLPPPDAVEAAPSRDATPATLEPAAPVPFPTKPAPPKRPSREDSGRTEISALVERIAQFRRERGESRQELERSPRLPLGELPERHERPLTSFGFSTETTGRIAWASAEVAPMVIGARLFTPLRLGDQGGMADAVERAFVRRQPISGGEISLSGAPAIAGDWIVDAEPQFSREGHFTGYFGRMRRLLDDGNAQTEADTQEADRIRQLLHELRTPVTAVQGYAEVIQQQLFGPAPHEYRALAAAIAADAAHILAGFEELDRLARLETGALGIEPGDADLAALIRRTADQLNPVLASRGALLSESLADDAMMLLAIDADDAEALVWRLLASLAAACDSGETIAVSLDPMIGGTGARVRMRCTLPARLAAQDNVFAASLPTPNPAINAGLFGSGFALRLARAEARAAGGSLVRDGDHIDLVLPLMMEQPQHDAPASPDNWAATP
jgi:signal transduction histidine kinase